MLFMRTAGVVVNKHLRPIRMINISNNTVREMSHAVKIYRTKPLLLPLLTYIYVYIFIYIYTLLFFIYDDWHTCTMIETI